MVNISNKISLTKILCLTFFFGSLNAHATTETSSLSSTQKIFEILLADEQPSAIAYDTLRQMFVNSDTPELKRESYAELKAQLELGKAFISQTQYHDLMARFYRDGQSPFFDIQLAEQYFIQASADNHPEAAYELAKLYHYNDYYLDYGASLHFYEVSVKQGFARMWRQSYPKWQKFYLDLVAAAEYQLGKMYELGQGIEYNASKALDYYHAAARKKHHNATYRIAMIYKNGLQIQNNPSIEADPFAAIFWFEKLLHPSDPKLSDPEVLQQLENLYQAIDSEH